MFFQDIKMEQELTVEKKFDDVVDHKLHMHELLEVNVLINHEAQFKLLNQSFTGQSGDVFIFRPFVPHYNLAKDAAKPIEWIMVLFSPSIVRWIPYGYRLLYPFYTQTTSPHIAATSFYAKNIQAAAKLAYEEQERRLAGWESKQFMHFIDILMNIYRYTLDKSVIAGDNDVAFDEDVFATIEYILRHIMEDFDINDVIEQYGRSKTYFYTNFKQVVGVTPNQFVHRLRIQIAMHLLKTTQKTITEIAFECGYNSIHYFNKQFKQYREQSPREFRNLSKKVIG